jgi:hypothetical protein
MRSLSRRTMLETLGLGGALVPLVGLGSSAAAGATGTAKRMVIITTTNGVAPEHFFPPAPGSLADLAATRILAPLAPYRDRTIVIRGVGNAICEAQSALDGHDSNLSLLTGVPRLEGATSRSASGISVDQFLADHLAERDGPTAFHDLSVAVMPNGHLQMNKISFTGPDQPVPTDDDPYNVFTRLFGGGDLAQAERLRRQRRSVLDATYPRVAALRDRVGVGDRPRIDAHLQAIRDIERQLEVPACIAPEMPLAGDGSRWSWTSPALIEIATVAQIDLIAAALGCGATRIATFPLMSGGGEAPYPFLGVPGSERTHHDLGHNADNVADPGARETLVQYDTWHARMIARLCDKLDSIPEPEGGTMLDTTIVAWVQQMTTQHEATSIPIVMIGGAGGYLRTGQYVDYTMAGAQPLQRWLLTLCHAMGADVPSFGASQIHARDHTFELVNDVPLLEIIS